MTTETERAAFEAWAKPRYLDLTMATDAWDRPVYALPHIRSLFDGFQAGRASIPADDARAVVTSIDEMCAILKQHHIESDERTDCAVLYRVTFDQLRALYDRGRASIPDARAVPIPQLAQWQMAVICAEKEPYKQVILEGRTVLAVARVLAAAPAAQDKDTAGAEVRDESKRHSMSKFTNAAEYNAAMDEWIAPGVQPSDGGQR